jgi:hypothetical protein
MGKIKTPHNSIKRVWHKLSNRCVICDMKIPTGDAHFANDGKMYCGRCYHEMKEGEINHGK